MRTIHYITTKDESATGTSKEPTVSQGILAFGETCETLKKSECALRCTLFACSMLHVEIFAIKLHCDMVLEVGG